MIGEAKAGADPVPHKDLTAEKLADGIKQCLTEEARKGAEKIAKDIEAEGDGSKNAVTSFHRSLVLRGEHSMRCSILEDRVAVWSLKGTALRLSALAADLLVEKKKISWKQLRLIRHNEWNDFEGPGEPLSGGATAIMGTVTGIAAGVGSVPFKIAKVSKRRAKHEERKRKKSSMEAARKTQDGSRSGNGSEGMVNGTEVHDMATNGHVTIGEKDGNNENASKENASDSAAKGTFAKRSKPRLPGEGIFKATSGPDLGKHTETGEPMAQKHQISNEARQGDNASVLSDDPEENAATEIAQNVGQGVGKTAEIIARAPMDLTLAIAQGKLLFHFRTLATGLFHHRMLTWLKAFIMLHAYMGTKLSEDLPESQDTSPVSKQLGRSLLLASTTALLVSSHNPIVERAIMEQLALSRV